MRLNVINNKIKYIVVTLVIIFAISGIFLFVYDIGLNSEYFIKRDFNKAFLARKTGDCYLFLEYVYSNKDEWSKACIREKDQEGARIVSFTIKDITARGSDAFLSVELQRELNRVAIFALAEKLSKEELERLEKYSVNYDLIRDDSSKFLYIVPRTRWLIKNEMK